jgi:hypothetical protein
VYAYQNANQLPQYRLTTHSRRFLSQKKRLTARVSTSDDRSKSLNARRRMRGAGLEGGGYFNRFLGPSPTANPTSRVDSFRHAG